MAHYPALRNLILEGFVRPLVIIVDVMANYVLHDGSARAAADQFISSHEDAETVADRLLVLLKARQVLDGNSVELSKEQSELTRLLIPALNSRHVRWSLIEPIKIYHSALQAYQ